MDWPLWVYPLLFLTGLVAGLVMKKGARFIRPVFLTMVALTLLRLVYVTAFRPS